MSFDFLVNVTDACLNDMKTIVTSSNFIDIACPLEVKPRVWETFENANSSFPGSCICNFI